MTDVPSMSGTAPAPDASESSSAIRNDLEITYVSIESVREYKNHARVHNKKALAKNRLDRNFAVERPNQVWLADIIYVPTGEGWLYLAVVLDLCTRKIIRWAMRDHMRAELSISALPMAIQRQKPHPGLIHHSDRGSQICRSRIPQTHQGSRNGPIHEQKRKLLG